VPNVFREHHTQVPLTKDQYPVGDFGSDRADEPFGKTIRLRATRRNLDHADAHVSKDSVEGLGELTGPISDEKLELRDAIAKIHHQIADLLRRPPAVRVRGHAQQMHRPASDLQHEKHIDPLECHRAVHREKVARQHGRRLGAQELSPGRVSVPGRRGWYP
jgi:hypothetical protein